MKTIFGLVVVNAAALVSGLFAAAPAQAEADLPFTPAFAQAVGQYRDCVLGGLDRSTFAQPDRMAAAAMAACERAHDMARAQLTADLARAGAPHQAAKAQANAGMAKIDPMIAAVALDQARSMQADASATHAPALTRPGTIG